MYACMDSTASLINNHHQNPKLHVYLVQQPQNVYPVTQTPKKATCLFYHKPRIKARAPTKTEYNLYFIFFFYFNFCFSG